MTSHDGSSHCRIRPRSAKKMVSLQPQQTWRD